MPKAIWTDAEDPRGANTREFRIDHEDRRPVTGAVWLPDQPRTGHLLIALGHGASGDKRIHANPGLHPAVPYEEVDASVDFLRSHLEGRAERRIIDPFT